MNRTIEGSRAARPEAMRGLLSAVLLTAVLATLAAPATAQVVRMQVDRREPFAGGKAFGAVGPYERLVGSLYVEVDPNDPANRRIHDLQLAPRDDHGMVEYRTDFYLLKPVDPSKGNGRLLYDVHNRGNKVALGTFDGAGGNDPDDPGTGFLMVRGYSVLWTGWSGDVLPGAGRLTSDMPVATEHGRTITGRIYTEMESGGYQLYRNNSVTRTRAPADSILYSIPFDWGGSRSYPSVSLDNSDATLTMRPYRDAPATVIPRDEWAFARFENERIVPDSTHVYVKAGFRLGWLYDLVYVGRNPRVTGLSLSAVRDPVSFFRYEEADEEGHANPLAGAIQHAYGFGVSQSGRFLNHMLWEGFDVDTHHRPVFDGVFAEVAGGGKGLFNYRFWQTTRHGSQHEENLYPSDFFPFTSTPETDPVTGEHGSELDRARAEGFVPKIFYLQTSTEYWSRAASLIHTDVEGKRDLPLDPNVRIYVVSGAPHTSMTGGHYDNPLNRLSRGPVSRALLDALDRWVGEDVAPPPSRYPKISNGTLVPADSASHAFPKIPGVRAPAVHYAPYRLDLGPRWQSEGIADNVPPKTGPRYTTLVPAVDADGLDLGGIRLPDVAVPIATYTGWNLRTAAWGADGALTRWMGSYLEFPRTKADAQASGDPRRSILERYPTRADYLRRNREAIRNLEEQRLLLPADGAALLETAEGRSYWN